MNFVRPTPRIYAGISFLGAMMKQYKHKTTGVCGKSKSKKTMKPIVFEVESQTLVHELDVSAMNRGSQSRLWIPHLRPPLHSISRLVSIMHCLCSIKMESPVNSVHAVNK
jgi:hypothetical protein